MGQLVMVLKVVQESSLVRDLLKALGLQILSEGPL